MEVGVEAARPLSGAEVRYPFRRHRHPPRRPAAGDVGRGEGRPDVVTDRRGALPPVHGGPGLRLLDARAGHPSGRSVGPGDLERPGDRHRPRAVPGGDGLRRGQEGRRPGRHPPGDPHHRSRPRSTSRVVVDGRARVVDADRARRAPTSWSPSPSRPSSPLGGGRWDRARAEAAGGVVYEGDVELGPPGARQPLLHPLIGGRPVGPAPDPDPGDPVEFAGTLPPSNLLM